MIADEIADAIDRALISPNVADANFESANLVDTTQRVAEALHRIADALDRAIPGAENDDQEGTP